MNVPLVVHNSALEFWRYASAGALPNASASRTVTRAARKELRNASSLSPEEIEVFEETGCLPFWCSAPLHVLVDTPRYQGSKIKVVNHFWTGKLPEKSFTQSKDGWFIAMPEFLFLQMARDLSFIELVYLAYELCGTYAIRGTQCVFQRNFALTSVKKLLDFAANNRHVKYASKALKATKYALDGAASPMETIVSMLLTLPYKYGGYSLRNSQLNARIDVPIKLRDKVTKNYYKCDIYWPNSKVALEYDSNAFHLGAQKIMNDAQRRNDLSILGVKVITATARQVFNKDYFETLAHTLAKALNKRLRYDMNAFMFTNAALRDELFRLVNHPAGEKKAKLVLEEPH